ncbi:MAG TPA: methyltransferase domain-containing protein, partial [Dongiaceae bacterium]
RTPLPPTALDDPYENAAGGRHLMTVLSPRLSSIVDALPLRDGMRVLEIGCGPGAAAREVARRIAGGHVLVIDRSARAIAQARAASAAEIAAGRLSLRRIAVEVFELEPGEAPYDIAFAVRVGVLDGRHPEKEAEARRRIAAALTQSGRLFLDGGDPLREICRRGTQSAICWARRW